MDYKEALEKLKLTSQLKITVSGDIGAGKSTFAKHLAEVLDIPRIYIGQFMREEATNRGITLDELSKLQETDDALDRHFDEMQRQKSLLFEKGVFEGRTARYFVENPTVTVYLAVDQLVATDRIWQDRSDKRDKYGTQEALNTANELRKQSEIKRYQKYYGIDVYDKSKYDIVINTTNLNIDEVFEATVLKIAEYII